MIMKNCKTMISLLSLMGLITGCAEKKLKLANPASQYCVEKGGVLKILKHPDGGEYGVCFFTDNRQCEEWSMFRGECPVGGLKITGYLTPEGIYCVIKGGKALENETVCQLSSGKKCLSKDFYEGKCSQ